MKTHLNLALVLGPLFVISGAAAQNKVSNETPAAAPVASAPAPAPSQVIYSPRLPTAVELTNAAAAQGVAIDRIEQTAAQVTVAYKFSDGQTKTVAYLLLPSPGAAPSPAPAPVVVPATTPAATTTVYYDPSPRVIYYEPSYYPYSYVRDWYPPVSLSLGLGFGFHGGGGYYRGGFHGRR